MCTIHYTKDSLMCREVFQSARLVDVFVFMYSSRRNMLYRHAPSVCHERLGKNEQIDCVHERVLALIVKRSLGRCEKNLG